MIRAFFFFLCLPGLALAQDKIDPNALGEIRGELSALAAEIEGLRALLLAEGATRDANDPTTGTAILRLGQLEERIQAITGDVEELRFGISAIVADATNRFGDLEFRVTELEGGDISALGTTPVLGAAEIAATSPAPAIDTGTEVSLAVGEKADFLSAEKALADGEFANAADKFSAFVAAYPGGPYAVDALFGRGDALRQLGRHKDAARSYLDAFTAAPDGALAAKSLMRVGTSLRELGQREQSCATLNEVITRYAQTDAALEAIDARADMGCG